MDILSIDLPCKVKIKKGHKYYFIRVCDSKGLVMTSHTEEELKNEKQKFLKDLRKGESFSFSVIKGELLTTEKSKKEEGKREKKNG